MLRIEATTKLQAKSSLWHQEREWRITASNFGIVTSLTERRNISKLCTSLLSPKLLTTAPVLHGTHYEPIAVEKFTEVTGLDVRSCGLFVSEQFPFLAATPDGLVEEDGILEVKCPYSGREQHIMVGKLFPYLTEGKDKQLELKQGHRYYDQVQGQLYIAKKNVCYFAVFTFKDLKVIKIPINHEYCEMSLIPKLQSFYTQYYRPFIAKKLYMK